MSPTLFAMRAPVPATPLESFDTFAPAAVCR